MRVFAFFSLFIASQAFGYTVSLSYDVGSRKVLGQVSGVELVKRKSLTLTEMEPTQSKNQKFMGASLSDLVNEKIASLTAAERANLDLVVLKSRTGKEVLMPRAFLHKYNSILVAYQADGKEIGGEEIPKVILPASSNAKIKKEGILLDALFISALESVTLTSYQARYGQIVLKRRTDPAAMRGEKLFLQNCAGCHMSGGKTAEALAVSGKISTLENTGHPKVVGVKSLSEKLDSKQVRSLVSYLEAYQSQTKTQ